MEEAAAHYSDPAFRVGVVALGVDVANSEAGDEAAIAQGRGACLFTPSEKAWAKIVRPVGSSHAVV